MAAKKRGLGKGLDALLSPGALKDVEAVQPNDQLTNLAVDLMQRGQYQPRNDMDKDALQELANSIKAQGLIQPIVVRPISGSQQKYEIIAGERRWRASQIAGLHEVPVVIREIDDHTAMCMALIENIQREDLNPLDEAEALYRLIDEFDMTHEAVAESVGRSRSSVSNLLRLLELDSKVKDLVKSRQIEMGHARALLSLPGNKQQAVANDVVKKALSVRATEALVRQYSTDKKASKSSAKPVKDPNITKLEQDLSEKLGAKVTIEHTQKGTGCLAVHYHNLDALQGILDRIK